jgi:FkbM family methyltransferase
MKIPGWRRPPGLPAETKIGKPHIVERALPFVRRWGCAIQAGAHVGVWPAMLAPKFQRVLTFEPAAHLAAATRGAVTARNVTLFECALSDHAGEVPFSIAKPERYSGSSAVAPSGAAVICVTIDGLNPFLTEDCGLIMLDIEGHELPALQGAAELLARCQPVVTVEENDKSLRHRAAGDVARFLQQFGYRQVAKWDRDLVFCAG